MKAAIAALAALLAATAAPVLADAPRDDTLVDNVHGETVSADGRVETFIALVFGNDGTIRQVIHSGEKKPKAQYRIDGKGRTMLPGLIDAHLHVMALGFAALTLDLSDTKSLAEAQASIRAYAAAHPDRPWIIGRGWNQEVWGLGRFPTAAEIDAIVPDRPVWLERVDGHAGWANSAALRNANVTAASKDPAGGRIERDATGKPAGVLVDAAKDLVGRTVPPPRAVDRDLALATAQQLLFKRGVTAAADMGTSMDDWQAFRRAGDRNRLYLRIMSYALGIDAMIAIAGPEPTPWLYQDRLRMGGVKLYLDGALGSRGAWLKKPYADAPGTTGLPQLSQTQLGNLMSRAAMDGFQVAVHAIGDQSVSQMLGEIEELSATYKGDRRWRIEHMQIVDPANFPDVARLAQSGTGVVASMQPVHQTSDRLMAKARLGPDRLLGAYAWNTLKARGATLAFGSDAPVEAPDPFAGIAAAISREGPDGQPSGGWQPQERVDRATALAGYTSAAAYAGFAEKRFGRLAPGLRADFIFVDTDPMIATPAQIRATKVLETWIGGGKVYAADAPVSADAKSPETKQPDGR
ncbi:amidohydrolase [Novosphingobium lentum]|uniref:amidohydrolase n=1 Tax=Novosphingobium lentum TaxID=145287 RepID=UPI0008320A2C|nr:amidohydrolase [Novosphingobium lentum]